MYTIHKKRRAFHKSWRKLSKKYSNHHPFVIPTAVFLLCFFVASASMVAVNGQTIGASDSRIVNLYVDNERQVVPTRAETVGDLMKRLNIYLGDQDLVEPALDTPILADNFKVTVYRAKPVTIIDQSKKIQILTPHQDDKLAIEKAGITVFPEDRITLDHDTDPLEEGIIGKRLVIDRATPVTINLYGNPVQMRTRAKTVGDVLAEKEIQIIPTDTITPGVETPLTANTEIVIARLGTKIVTVEEAILFETETQQDPNQPVGVNQIITEGVNGKKIVTYEVELKNDQEVSRKQIQVIIAQEPVKAKVTKGTKVIYSNPSANVELGRQIAEEMGVGGEFHCLYQLWERESKWNHLAANRSSGAYGIPQALPGSKMGPGWQNDPAVQIRWGIGYVKKYGGPCGAWAFWQVNHWY